jgi:hypothetical protein
LANAKHLSATLLGRVSRKALLEVLPGFPELPLRMSGNPGRVVSDDGKRRVVAATG